MKINLNNEWKKYFKKLLEKDSFENLWSFLEKEYSEKDIFPEMKNIFRAFNEVPLKDLKVIIVGQDPYHTPGVAEGLCFSIPRGSKVLPSIKNIYKELKTDLNIDKDFTNGNLEYLTKQGVLLINQVLTVESHKPGSHWKQGWEEFTAKAIEKISQDKENIVFILWGKNAQEIESHIKNPEKHLILKSAHPSPFSAHRGFFGNKHFSKTNNYLKSKKKKEINW